MENRAVRFLAFGLGSLLLFHGVDKVINGINFIESLIMGEYVPYVQHASCRTCVSTMMYGKEFMEKVLTGSSTPYNDYIKYVASGVYIGEVVAPLFLIFGRYIRLSAVVIAFNMLVALFLVHKDELFTLDTNGVLSIETPMLYLIMAITLVLWKPTK